MSDPNPYESPKSAPTDSSPEQKSKPEKSQKWQLVLVGFAVAGYLLGWMVRESLGLSGAIPGAIFGLGGTFLAVSIGMAIMKKVDPSARV